MGTEKCIQHRSPKTQKRFDRLEHIDVGGEVILK